jgi:hypothetical protein
MIVSGEFERSIRYIFENCDEESVKSGKSPFTTNTRSLLVDSILNNLTFKKTKKDDASHTVEQYMRDVKSKADSISQRGLPYMLNEEFFDEAFVLHETTNHHLHLRTMIDYSLSSLHAGHTSVEYPEETHDVTHLINENMRHQEGECNLGPFLC